MNRNSPWCTARSRTSSSSVSLLCELTTVVPLPLIIQNNPVYPEFLPLNQVSAFSPHVPGGGRCLRSFGHFVRWSFLPQPRQVLGCLRVIRASCFHRGQDGAEPQGRSTNTTRPEPQSKNVSVHFLTARVLQSLRLPGSQPGFYCTRAHTRAASQHEARGPTEGLMINQRGLKLIKEKK